MKINNKLKQYIEENVFPEYKKNDQGHDLEHIKLIEVLNLQIQFQILIMI